MRTGCATACLRRASTGRPRWGTFACTGYPATCLGCEVLAVALSCTYLQVTTAMASWELDLLQDYVGHDDRSSAYYLISRPDSAVGPRGWDDRELGLDTDIHCKMDR
eukprot:9499035-Pyramimonas_sp.AAC.1